MSDYDNFKDVINGFEKKLKPECEDLFLVHSTFRDIRDMVETMIQSRDKRIKELAGKSSPKAPHISVEKPTTDKPTTDKPEKVCPPGKIVNPKTGRCINKPKEKTHKNRGRPKKTFVAPPETMPSHYKKPSSEKSTSLSFDEALEHIRTNGKPGSYRTFMNGIKKKFGITLKYDNHGDDYAAPDLYFMKGKKECSRAEMERVMKYVIDTAEKSKSPPVSKYHQKQYEKFVKSTNKDNLKEAFVEKKPEEPEKEQRYNLRGMN